MKYKTLAISAAREAGREILKNFDNNRRQLTFKSKHEIATFADKHAEKIIISRIKKYFPDHHILSEEAGDNKKKSPYLWIIDPVDGTTNYYMHNPLFAVSIGLAYNNEIIFGVIYAPALKELYIAEKGCGAILNGKKLKVSTIKNLKKSLLTFCHGSPEKAIKRAIKGYNHFKLHGFDMRQLGSASIELGFVAAGRVESIAIPNAHSWDIAAGVLLVREAGGKVTDYNGKEWNLSSRDIVASNGKIHNKLIDIYKKI